MPDQYTTTASVNFDQAAYDRLVYLAFRPELHFDAVTDVKPTNQSMPGSSVIFDQVADLAVVSTAINESVDVDAVAISDSQVTVTLAEYGNAVISTAKLRGTSYLPVDRTMAELIGYNAGQSIDSVAANVLKGGSNVRYAGQATARNTVIPTDKITSNKVRLMYRDLEANNVPKIGGYYAAIIHPDVKFDLREETGAGSWRDPHVYSAPSEIWNNEIGEYEGFRFMVTTRSPIYSDAGSSTTLTDVYASLFLGRQALAKAYSQIDGNGEKPKVIPGPITDKLRRFVPLGWYWLGGYNIFRQVSVRRLESASSVGTNS